jgi:hypothetical protein
LQAGGRRFDPVWLHQTGGHDLAHHDLAHHDPAHDDPLLGGSGWLGCLARMMPAVFEASGRHPFLLRLRHKTFVAAMAAEWVRAKN